MNDRRKILIAGKNSSLYRRIQHYFLIGDNTVTAISHTDDFPTYRDEYDVCIVFSISDAPEKFRDYLHLLFGCSKRVVLVSSLVCELPNFYDFYRYVRVKKMNENIFTQVAGNGFEKDWSIIRFGVVGDCRAPISVSESVFVSTLLDLNCCAFVSAVPVINCHSDCPTFYRKIYCLPYFPVLMRPLDFILKLLGKMEYGYSFALKNYVSKFR